MTEGQSQDEVDWRKFFFVSCWSANEEESIPLWNLYTPDMKGVRIKLPIEMFKKHLLDISLIPDFINIVDTSSAPVGAKVSVYSYLPYERMHGESYIVLPPSFEKARWPFPVEYTNDNSKLNQVILKRDELSGQTVLSPFEVAKYKSKVWEFQSEWRFRLYCHSAAPRSLSAIMPSQQYYELMLKELSDLTKGVGQEYMYLDVDDAAFEDLQVVLGPKVDPAHKIIVEALISAYCPKAIMEISRLSGSIR